MSARKNGIWDNVHTAGGSGKSKFAVLADDLEDVPIDVERLKAQIRTIPCRPSSGGHEKARIKLERGLHTKTGIQPHDHVTPNPAPAHKA